jgi:hypothetical protein
MAGIFVGGMTARDVVGRLVDRLRQDYAAEQLFKNLPATFIAGICDAADLTPVSLLPSSAESSVELNQGQQLA